MNSPRKLRKANKIANHIESLKGEIISRWREEVRSNPELTALVHKLDDQELEDHLPALTDKIISLLRGETAKDLEEDAGQHGRQRRAEGYSVVSLLRELQIFRRVLTSMVREVVGENSRAEETERARNLIIDSVDRSMNISVSQYTLMAEGERTSAQGGARASRPARSIPCDALPRTAQSGLADSARCAAAQGFKTIGPPNGSDDRANRAAGTPPSHIDR
jgi:hypothetical protein